MRNLFFVLLGTFVCSFSVVFAQRQEIDSLKKVLPKYTEGDTNHINTLNKLALTYYTINPDTTLIWAKKALVLASKHQYDRGIVEALRNKGIAIDVKGDYTEALRYYFKALSLAENIGYKKGIANLYNDIALIYKNQDKYAEAMESYFKSLKIFEEIADARGIAVSLNNIANIYMKRGNYPEALQNHFKALKIREKIRDRKGIATSLNNIANTYENQGKYAEGLENYFKSLQIFEEIGDAQRISVSLNNIAIIYTEQGKYTEALETHLKSLKIREELGDRQGIAASLNNIANVYTEQGKYTEALENHFKSLKISEEKGNKQVVAYNLNNIASVYEKQSKYAKALENHFKSLKISEEIGNKRGVTASKNGLAKVYLALKNYASALQYAQEGLEIAKEIGQKAEMRDINETLSKIYKAMGKYELALKYYEQYKSYSDSLNNLEVEKKTANLQAQYEFDKKTTLMQAEQAKKDIVQEKQRNQLYWIIFSSFVGLVSTFVILFLIFRSRKKIQKAYSKLEISNAKVQQAKTEIETQAEELQKLNHFKDRLFSIIAHDLRSPMATLQGTISILDPAILNESELATIKATLTKQFEVTDKILQDLLQWTKDQMKGETIDAKLLNLHEIVKEKINLFLTVAQHKNIILLSETTPDTQVFADENHVNIILQNLLSNALKFTYVGGKITITSQNVDSMVQIAVKDTGKGMNEEQQSKLFSAQYFTTKGTSGEKGNGLGLYLVKELVEKNGGKIGVKSEEGKGSEFCFLLPMIG